MEFEGWKIKNKIKNVDNEVNPPDKYENTLHLEDKEIIITKKPTGKKRKESLVKLTLGEKLIKKIRINT